ncbi:MAG: UDP-N-acetylmuramoyl-L-alanine--D-glutamate ligase [Candidatus Peribacteraceae bacterium]|nr:UDP-N-acetylmuramoyl-L-alanine--D-glutamate ligase [Candidatus Peribacteraceae bacterium]
MHIKDLSGKNVCILGFGREGQATLAALERYAPSASITIADRNTEVKVPGIHTAKLGETWLDSLDSFDVIIKSPGIPPQPQFDAVQSKITSATQIFFDSVVPTGATVIGITGSKGKSTTSSLIYAILKAGGKNAFLVGNIGVPAITYISEATPDTYFVYELSSYQLMDTFVSPTIAVVTSFFPEHLDYHGSLQAYMDAKKHIARFQTEHDKIFFNAQWADAAEIARESKGQRIPYLQSECPVDLEEVQLIGQHNLANITAAIKVGSLLQIPEDIMLKAVKSFKGLPHRLESLGIHDGIEWVNDSISTTPQSAMAALNALDGKVGTMILGGQDRGYDFQELAQKIVQHPTIKHIILMPDSGATIGKALEKTSHTQLPKLWNAADMKEAVSIAKENTPKTFTCLLSPASPSYGHFKNFEDRGEQFKKEIGV